MDDVHANDREVIASLQCSLSAAHQRLHDAVDRSRELEKTVALLNTRLCNANQARDDAEAAVFAMKEHLRAAQASATDRVGVILA